jgi:hypothetical protein
MCFPDNAIGIKLTGSIKFRDISQHKFFRVRRVVNPGVWC